MATCEQTTRLVPLDLPEEFDGLDELIRIDLKAVVRAVVERAHERLLLTKREHRALQAEVWNGMVEALNAATAPLSLQNR